MSKEHKIGPPIRDFFRRPIGFLRGIPPSSLAETSAGQRLPRRERRETERARRQLLQQWQEGRRRLLRSGGIVLAGVAVGGVGVLARAAYEASKEKPFTGEIEETRSYLQRWGKEVSEDPEKLKQYLPRIADLTIAFYSKQMGYEKEQFGGKITLLNRVEYKAKRQEFTGGNELGKQTPAFVDNVEGRVYLNKDLGSDLPFIAQSNNSLAEVTFSVVLHELFHLSPKLKKYDPAISITGIREPVAYEKGLIALARENTPGEREIRRKYRYQIEETVVHHATGEKAKLLGIAVKTVDGYDDWVQKYHDFVLIPYYGGNEEELLGYQQRTEPDKFFQSIGQKLEAKTLDEQREVGDAFLKTLFVPH